MPLLLAEQMQEKIKKIAVDPFAVHSNVTKLHGREGYRIRIGDWRVIYKIQKDKLIIIVVKIAQRGEVYR